MPRRCPSCGTSIVHEGPQDRCPNGLACPAQLKAAIEHFGSRPALDIRGLGTETVDALVSGGLVKSVADLFTLKAADLRTVQRFAEISTRNLLESIEHARHPDLGHFLYALGIPGVGSQTARDLARHFGRLDAIMNAGDSDLRAVPGIGPTVSAGITAFFHRRQNRRIIDQCLKRGVTPRATARATRGRLAGQTVVFTGSLAGMTRDEAQARVLKEGGQVSGSVGRHTDLVVAGDSPGSKYRPGTIARRPHRRRAGVPDTAPPPLTRPSDPAACATVPRQRSLRRAPPKCEAREARVWGGAPAMPGAARRPARRARERNGASRARRASEVSRGLGRSPN